jgi:NitT/TauT family transport system substrate-binding protein
MTLARRRNYAAAMGGPVRQCSLKRSSRFLRRVTSPYRVRGRHRAADTGKEGATMLTRRQALHRGAGAAAALTVGPLLAACAPAAPPAAAPAPTQAATLPPPETRSIKLTAAPCDSAIYGAEQFLREEGFTDIGFSDAATAPALAAGNAHLGWAFVPQLFGAVQSGQKVVALGGLHPGCAEIWAQPGISSVKDLKGRTIVVQAKTIANVPYSYMAMVLKQVGVDPKDVNFVVQADANPNALYFDGKNDAVFVAQVGAVALKANPANKGKVIHSQTLDEPWKSLNCCFIIASEEWVRANPIAAKRAMRAIYRTADTLPADRADAAKFGTDKGLFGGAGALANVREAANMVPLDWRAYDLEKAVRFYAPLFKDVGLVTASVDDFVKVLDLKIFKELSTELKK